jgi:quercetin dioxygenase-like cupin family protein
MNPGMDEIIGPAAANLSPVALPGLLALVLLAPPAAPSAVELENDVVRVIHPRIGPGESKPMHSHPGRVVICLTDMRAEQTLGDGRVVVRDAKAGDVRWSPPITHAVRNLAPAPMELIEVELKPLAKSRAVTLPDRLGQDPDHFAPVLENDEVRVLRFRLGPHEAGKRHTDTPHVSVFLTDAHLELTDAAGQVREAQVKAGTVAWSGAEEHAPRNLGDQPIELLSVEPKAAPE